MRFVDKLVRIFGGIPFIILFNVISFWWFYEGKFNTHFFDPFPSNFFTFLVSWLAINMSSLILFAELKSKRLEHADEESKRKMLEAILTLAESIEDMLQELKRR